MEESNIMDINVANEILQDMRFISKLVHIQDNIEDDWLKDYYYKIAVSYLSIVLHECFQAGLLDKEKSDKRAVALLSSIRERIVKLLPTNNSSTIKNISDKMGIDFDHYCFDLQIALNKANNDELFDIGFTYYDLFKDIEEQELYNVLITIPLQIVEDIVSTTSMKKHRNAIDVINQTIYSNTKEFVTDRIVIKKYPYASGVFFKPSKIGTVDKVVVLYYYTLFKQAINVGLLMPEYSYHDEIAFDTTCAKCKYRAVIIENMGQFLKESNSPLSRELQNVLKDTMKPSFYPINRKVRNNIHYKETMVFTKDEILEVYSQQERYLKTVLDVFDEKIDYNVGLKYRIIKHIADKTDATMIEVRKKNKSIKKIEDVTLEEWENARERLRRKRTKS